MEKHIFKNTTIGRKNRTFGQPRLIPVGDSPKLIKSQKRWHPGLESEHTLNLERTVCVSVSSPEKSRGEQITQQDQEEDSWRRTALGTHVQVWMFPGRAWGQVTQVEVGRDGLGWWAGGGGGWGCKEVLWLGVERQEGWVVFWRVHAWVRYCYKLNIFLLLWGLSHAKCSCLLTNKLINYKLM